MFSKEAKTMRALDMVPIIKKYSGYFVALSYDRKKVLGKGRTPENALKEAREKGFKDPILTKIPKKNSLYLL